MKKLRPTFRCPTCGQAIMQAKSGAYRCDDGTLVSGVEWDECRSCGERMLDPANAIKVVGSARPAKRPKSARGVVVKA